METTLYLALLLLPAVAEAQRQKDLALQQVEMAVPVVAVHGLAQQDMPVELGIPQ
jgi:hypothetical protein